MNGFFGETLVNIMVFPALRENPDSYKKL
jgi:hypothetical protein